MNQFWQHKCAIKNPTNEVKQQIKKMRTKAGDELEKAIKAHKETFYYETHGFACSEKAASGQSECILHQRCYSTALELLG